MGVAEAQSAIEKMLQQFVPLTESPILFIEPHQKCVRHGGTSNDYVTVPKYTLGIVAGQPVLNPKGCEFLIPLSPYMVHVNGGGHIRDLANFNVLPYAQHIDTLSAGNPRDPEKSYLYVGWDEVCDALYPSDGRMLLEFNEQLDGKYPVPPKFDTQRCIRIEEIRKSIEGATEHFNKLWSNRAAAHYTKGEISEDTPAAYESVAAQVKALLRLANIYNIPEDVAGIKNLRIKLNVIFE